MAYAAAVSLKNTIHRLLNSSRISVDPEYLEQTYDVVDTLESITGRESRNRHAGESRSLIALEADLRDAAWKLEDVLESHLSTQVLTRFQRKQKSQRVTPPRKKKCQVLIPFQKKKTGRVLIESDPIPSVFSIDLEEAQDELESFCRSARVMGMTYDKAANEAQASTIYYGGNTMEMIGFTDIYSEIRDVIVENSPTVRNVSICGMAGIGKTTLAKKIFEDPLVKEKFERRIFVPVGLQSGMKIQYQLIKILQAILAQVKPDSDEALMGEVLGLDEDFWNCLIDMKTLIVLDDLWESVLLDLLRRRLPNRSNGCMILVTTRQRSVGKWVFDEKIFNMRFMNNKESWDLLRGRVFGTDEEVCVPSQLEKAGKKIAENCEGLPLLIDAVASLLSEVERTPEYWNKIAADKENHIFVDAYDQISEVLLSSFNFLPQRIKPCFLYLRVFPQDHRFRRSRLAKLWSAEEFLDIHSYKTNKGCPKKCLKELVSNNVVVVHRESEWRHGVKLYSLHSGFWYLCKKQAGSIKFLHTFNRYADSLEENSIERQRRLSIYKNTLFAIKDVYDSVASVSNARSLLCTGPYHQYQVPICFDSLSLLRVLDTLTVRFYEFPMDVLQLVLLRYFALTYNDDLPPSIFKLWNLQCLIVHQHLSIKFTLAESYLPVEIWSLQELQYLEIMGRNLLGPPRGVVLRKLSTLLDVDAHSCTEDVLKGIPKLEKLRVRIELAPNVVEPPLTCFDHISRLRKLKSFQCVVVNPEIVAPPPPLSIFGSALTKLTLRGFGYPWEAMNKIAELPSLFVLKLQCYAFQGDRWEVKEKGFLSLKYLFIEDTDLVRWTSGSETFLSLRYLTMKNCYKLHEIPDISTLDEIKLVDCNPFSATCVKQMAANACKVSVYSSWADRNLKS